MARLEIELIPALSDNYIYLLHEPQQGMTAVVDPAEAGPVLEALRRRGSRLDLALITHHHADHIGGLLELKARTGCRAVGPRADAHRIPGLDQLVDEGDRVVLGALTAAVIATPGHTSGHISYWFPEAEALFCADTLFALGCGRLFEGDAPTMWRSLQKLAALPDATRVYCGHEYTLSNARFALTIDPDNPRLRERAAEVEAVRARGEPTIPSTIGLEKATNPFLRAADPAIRRRLGLEQAPDFEVFGEIRRRKDRA
ncbi:hydroxyacylglutathione hydrolase [Benzoatithermus flavus]|uniref:Hydroxyacylglutathione hydrolase n=1 Tax=Benzoatithermus flavus TaxID=3108223 RepID=A0ABU8XTG6_9PROT